MNNELPPEVLNALILAFDSATRSLEACRLLLSRCVAEYAPETYEPDEEVEQPVDGKCHHENACEVTTLGDQGPLWLCPDCGEQFS